MVKCAIWYSTILFSTSCNKCSPIGFGLAHALVFRNVRIALGMDRCKYMATVAAPISLEILDYFSSLNIPIMEIYGMSETSGPHSMSSIDQYRFGASGAALS